jgi:hypothetical protein
MEDFVGITLRRDQRLAFLRRFYPFEQGDKIEKARRNDLCSGCLSAEDFARAADDNPRRHARADVAAACERSGRPKADRRHRALLPQVELRFRGDCDLIASGRPLPIHDGAPSLSASRVPAGGTMP